MDTTSPIISERSLSRQYVRNSNSGLHARGSQNRLVLPKTPASSLAIQIAKQNPPEERKPRMVINKMILNNFKSYFGRQEIGPFHKV